MATSSEVKAGLDGIASVIAGSIQGRANAKALLLSARNQLAGLPAQYADVLATINAYTPTGAFETLAEDELAKMTTEFTALKTALQTELTAIGVSF